MAKKPKTVAKKKVREIQATHDLVVSCDGGRYAYVFVEGHSRHFDTSTPEFLEAVREVRSESLVKSFATRWPDSRWPEVVNKMSEGIQIDG